MKTMSAGLESWPVDNVSAAVIGGPQAGETFGDIHRVYELASVTKLLAAYGFLIAVEEGVFELDQPVADNGATVAHLLAHAGGVGFKKGDPIRELATRRVYSSYGFEILAEKVADEAQMPFSEYLAEAVFQPLGMTTTTLWGSPGHEARSTVADLVAFADEVVEPTLLSPETVALACRDHFSGLAGIVPGYGMQKPCPWGLGFELRGPKSPHWTGVTMPEDVVGHFGQSGTFLWLHRASRRGMVVLTDRAFGDWAKPVWQELNDAVWAGETLN